MVKNPLANAGDLAVIPGWGRSPGERNGHPVPSILAWRSKAKGGGAWRAIVHGAAKESHMTEQLTLTLCLHGANVCG